MGVKLIFMLSAILVLASCGQKTVIPKDQSPSKYEQIKRAEEAWKELDEEVEKEYKGRSRIEKPQERRYVIKEDRPKEEIYRKRYAYTERSIRIKTKYPVVNGLPVWVRNPNYMGYLGGVGVAKKIPGKGLAEQRRLAKQIALADLAKQIEVIVKAELTKVEINIDTNRLKYYKKKFESLSEQEVRDLLIKNAVIEDEWIDPETGDLYVWVVIK